MIEQFSVLGLLLGAFTRAVGLDAANMPTQKALQEPPPPPASRKTVRLQALERLRQIAETAHGYQGCFTTCLWSEAKRDPILNELGLPYGVDRHGDRRWRPNHDVYDFFAPGLGAFLFSGHNLDTKRTLLDALIIAERDGLTGLEVYEAVAKAGVFV